MGDGARSAIRRLPDGTVKQVGPLTGTRVWTVPGRANRPLATPPEHARALAPGAARLTSAELTPAEKNAVSHRGHALRALSEHVAAVLARG